MKLEIKHLAPYLPYGLKLQYVVREKVEKTGVLQSISHRDFETHPTRVSIEGLYNEEHIWMFKPILRPLSDLTIDIIRQLISFDIVEFRMSKEIEDDFSIEVNDEMVGWTALGFQEYQNIIAYHFDIFKLIPQGLAVDINTLSVE